MSQREGSLVDTEIREPRLEISYANQALFSLCFGPVSGLPTQQATDNLRAVLADIRAARVLGDMPRSYRVDGGEVVIPLGRSGWEIVATFDHVPGASALSAERIKIMGVREVSS